VPREHTVDTLVDQALVGGLLRVRVSGQWSGSRSGSGVKVRVRVSGQGQVRVRVHQREEDEREDRDLQERRVGGGDGLVERRGLLDDASGEDGAP
jgi:hypothetical protein